jgi:actin-related protein
MEDEQIIMTDIGSRNIKAGFCGDDTPKTVFPNVISSPLSQVAMIAMSTKSRYVGSEAQEKRGLLALKYPVQRGEVTDWDDFTAVMEHLTYNELRVGTPFGYVFNEPIFSSKKYRERLAEMVFEHFEVHNFYACATGILSMYASGRTSGIVLDIGEGLTQVMTMMEGFLIRSSCARINSLAGTDLNDYMLRLMALHNNVHLDVNHHNRDLAREIKEKMCFVAKSADEFEQLNKQASEQDMHKSYEIEDGSSINISNEQWQCPEVLFNPKKYLEKEISGVHELVVNAIESGAIDNRKVLYENVILSGGTTLLPNFPDRLTSEIEKLSPHAKVRVIQAPERFYFPWIGGSIVGSIGLNRYFLNKRQYEEYGPSAVHPTVYQTINVE